MPRRGFIPKREVLPDPVYGTVIVTKLINQVMYDGKRGVAQAVCYSAFETVAAKSGKDAMEVFNQAIANIMPSLEVKARRVGGATYQVPIEIRPERRQTLALRWLVTFARKRGERSMADRLAGEILDASNNTGNAVKRREDMHKSAEANKAFAHYRWLSPQQPGARRRPRFHTHHASARIMRAEVTLSPRARRTRQSAFPAAGASAHSCPILS